MKHPRVKPVRLRVHNDPLHVDSLRVVGYRLVGKDGDLGPVRRSYAEARLDRPEPPKPA